MRFETFDFDKQQVWEIYRNAKQAVGYYQDVIDSIEKRTEEGETFDRLVVKPGSKRRALSEEGIERLVEKFGREKIYQPKETLITIKEFEKLIPDKSEQEEYVEIKYGKNKIEIVEE